MSYRLYRFIHSTLCYRSHILSVTLPRPPVLFLLCLVLPALLLTGCSHQKAPEKTDALDYTVVSGTDIPDDLQDLIDERKEEPFDLTYTDGSCLYIAKGYGKQDGGGFKIVVNDFYRSTDSLVFDAELFGPKAGDAVSGTPSYPYIVIKTEYREEPVVFP